jgi:DNA gyrase subunit A
VIGKYHPHGDDAVYFALVRMAQEFSLRVVLIDGQGNFGSVDGDMPAAMRYTEVRMEKVTGFMLEDIDKDTVDFQDNYDGSEQEPTVLPARFPTCWSTAAASPSAWRPTSRPHNLGEVIDATLMAIMSTIPTSAIEELMHIVPGPDFPTGGIILGRAASARPTRPAAARSSCAARCMSRRCARTASADHHRDPLPGEQGAMIEKIAELVRDKRIEGISDIRDESDRDGMRVVIELKRDAVADVVLNQLYRFTRCRARSAATSWRSTAASPS